MGNDVCHCADPSLHPGMDEVGIGSVTRHAVGSEPMTLPFMVMLAPLPPSLMLPFHVNGY